MASYPWTDLRLTQAAEVAAEHGCACAVDVESLVEEVRRLRAETLLLQGARRITVGVARLAYNQAAEAWHTHALACPTCTLHGPERCDDGEQLLRAENEAWDTRQGATG